MKKTCPAQTEIEKRSPATDGKSRLN